MADRTREYQQYLVGCDRLGHEPVDAETFATRWQEFEDHAESLRAAERKGVDPEIAPEVRTEMQERIKDDPFVKAVLVGMSEAGKGR